MNIIKNLFQKKLKFRKLVPQAIIPRSINPGDAGLDLTATSLEMKDNHVEFGTGLSVEIPDGYVGLLFPRSSIFKTGLTLANCVGVIDSGYRGEVKLKFKPDSISAIENFLQGKAVEMYKVGDRIGQLVIMQIPKLNVVETDILSDTKRGLGGFGSTNNEGR
jgi:dUTP pyrophosphatase